jgi:3-dehydroquinate synthase class II
VEAALAEPVMINENGRRRKATKLQVIVKQLVNKAAQGDHRSIQLLMAFSERQQLIGKDGKPITIVELLSAIGPIDEN